MALRAMEATSVRVGNANKTIAATGAWPRPVTALACSMTDDAAGTTRLVALGSPGVHATEP